MFTNNFTEALRKDTKPLPMGIVATTHHMGVVKVLFATAELAAASIDADDIKSGIVTIAINDHVVETDLTKVVTELTNKGVCSYDANHIVGEAMCEAMEEVKGIPKMSTSLFHKKASALWLAN